MTPMQVTPWRAALLAVTLAVVPVGAAQTAGAETATVAQVTAETVFDLMQISDVVEVLHDEGLKSGSGMVEDYFPDLDPAIWTAELERIYGADRMFEEFRAAFLDVIGSDRAGLDEIAGFFGSDLGQRALTLEVEARRALLDEATEEAAKAQIADMAAEDDPRLQAIEDFVLANDLIESNVMGALNANLAYMRGMAAAGGLPADMTEEDMLAQVWSQEDAIRADTRDWMFPFLTLAYGPLEDDELAAYIDFSRSAAGQRMNAALFAAFDRVFVRISGELGAATARQMQGQDI